VAVVGDNSADYVVALYAVPRAGRVLTLINQRLHPTEQARLLERVGAGTVLGDGDRLRAVRPADRGSPDRAWLPFGSDELLGTPAGTGEPQNAPDTAPAWLIHTSGTTGPAKGVPLSHANLRAAIDAGGRGRPVVEGDTYLFPFPLCHVAAYNVLLQHDRGASVLLMSGFDARETLAAIERRHVTTVSLAPTMIVRLVEDPGTATTDLSSLRSIGYGAAPLPPAIRTRAEDLLGCRLVEGYGMTELSGNAAFDGIPDEAIELRVVDDRGIELATGGRGEIQARGPQVMGGYWEDARATEAAFADGWFRTGDIGRFDPDGRLTVLDRKKDIVITGGENVASREVEEVLASHPGVAEVAVVGVPDAEWGERIVALVVPTAGTPTDGLADSVVAHCRDHLAGFKAPRRVEFLDVLPVNATGKVDKVTLRAALLG
jgi:acyl-CoA synthetase (AMP-forming)/AMP-acid ligase II